jgi:hypothetical protein
MEPCNTYEALDSTKNEIRILRLKSRQHNCNNKLDEQNIVCVLERKTLDDAGEYLALSYVWENGFDPQEIIVSGYRRLASANLVDALRQLRRESEDVVLWADQLSINQQDYVEKASQIQKMRHIYKNATQVVAWLGRAADGSDVVVATLHQIGMSPPKSGILSNIIGEIQKTAPLDQTWDAWDERNLFDILGTAFPAFAARRYWTRLWVLQEFVLAKTVLIMCGSATIDDITFAKAWEVLGKAASKPGAVSALDIARIGEAWSRDPKWWDAWLGVKRYITKRDGSHRHQFSRTYDARVSEMFELMYQTLTTFSGQTIMACSDPRDRVFSLLGLATDSDKFSHFPDYSRSAENIYEEVARNFLQLGHVDTFSFCQEDPTKRARNMPSWAADWSLKIRIPLWGKIYPKSSRGWPVDLGAKILDEKTIHISGTCVDIVQSHSPPWSHGQLLTRSQGRALLQQLNAFCGQSSRIDEHENDKACAEMGASSALAYLRTKPLMLTQYRAVMKHLETVPKDAELEETAEFSSTYERELRLQFLRCPFITVNGYVGMAPPYVREGDHICIFPKGRTPYILRPQSGSGTFQLVGSAYVYGVMQGEFFKVDREVRSFAII